MQQSVSTTVRAPGAVAAPRAAFIASTGRTATTLLAAVLDGLPGVTALHEGQEPDDGREPRLPLINLQNRQAWGSLEAARAVVNDRRDDQALASAARDSSLIVDVAFYNSPLIPALADAHPQASLMAIIRRCEGFVRSATIVEGEDRQPAGWPNPSKPLTDRERFIEFGRLRPESGTDAADRWSGWSGIQRNIWLWTTVNEHLGDCAERLSAMTVLRFEDLRSTPERFWTDCLEAIRLDPSRHLEHCLRAATRPVNARSAYQVGPLETWTDAERDLFDQLARPLEERFYD
ncbi:MAG: hypothetical protein AAF567_07280 [Actinomycetota bacterium]